MNLGLIAKRNAEIFPEKAALISGDKSITFAELNERANRLANSLDGLGIRSGDRVALLLGNRFEFMECYFAISKIGAIAVPLNTRLAAQELAYIINDAGAGALVTDDVYLQLFREMAADLTTVKKFIGVGFWSDDQLDYEELIKSGSPAEPNFNVKEDDSAFLFYTSGTTGRPKGCILSHKNIIMDNYNIISEMNLSRDDIYLNALPMFHLANDGPMFATMQLGCTNVIIERPQPELMLKTIAEQKVTYIACAPTVVNMLVSTPGIEEFDLRSLRVLQYGGGPLMPQTYASLRKIMPGCSIYGSYGQTEASDIVSVLLPDKHEGRLNSCGRPVFGLKVKIVDENDNEMSVGEAGEIAVSGPTVMQGYWRMAEATSKAVQNGWLHTHDVGRLDEEGYLYVVDRLSDMIKTGGENVYPKEVENVLNTHPGVFESVVFGVPDAKWGETVKAAIVIKNGAVVPENELIEFCRGKVAGYKKPTSILLVDSIPRNFSGKVLRNVLRETFLSKQ